jgi:hypothetical protein
MADEEIVGLPSWLDQLLKPGVSSGVFTTLKLSLVSLIIILLFMLYSIHDSVRSTFAFKLAHSFLR